MVGKSTVGSKQPHKSNVWHLTRGVGAERENGAQNEVGWKMQIKRFHMAGQNTLFSRPI
jgi:hypothetical protein